MCSRLVCFTMRPVGIIIYLYMLFRLKNGNYANIIPTFRANIMARRFFTNFYGVQLQALNYAVENLMVAWLFLLMWGEYLKKIQNI